MTPTLIDPRIESCVPDEHLDSLDIARTAYTLSTVGCVALEALDPFRRADPIELFQVANNNVADLQRYAHLTGEVARSLTRQALNEGDLHETMLRVVGFVNHEFDQRWQGFNELMDMVGVTEFTNFDLLKTHIIQRRHRPVSVAIADHVSAMAFKDVFELKAPGGLFEEVGAKVTAAQQTQATIEAPHLRSHFADARRSRQPFFIDRSAVGIVG